MSAPFLKQWLEIITTPLSLSMPGMPFYHKLWQAQTGQIAKAAAYPPDFLTHNKHVWVASVQACMYECLMKPLLISTIRQTSQNAPATQVLVWTEGWKNEGTLCITYYRNTSKAVTGLAKIKPLEQPAHLHSSKSDFLEPQLQIVSRHVHVTWISIVLSPIVIHFSSLLHTWWWLVEKKPVKKSQSSSLKSG